MDRSVSPGYLATMGITLLEGRDFSERDTATSPPVALINQTMARTFWPNESAVGKGIRFGVSLRQASPSYTIVGVTGDIRELNLDQAPEPELLLPLTSGAFGPPFLWPRQLILRTTGDPLGQAGSVRRIVRSVDPNQPISSVRTMQDVVDQEFTSRDTQLILICAFAGLSPW